MKTFTTNWGKNIYTFVDGFTKILHWVIQLSAILAMIALSFSGIYKLIMAFMFFNDIYVFLKEILHSLEILFIAPIPILITFSYKKYVLALFNPSQSESVSNSKKFEEVINPFEAEKAFITSIIGITSTFILGLFFELLSIQSKTEANINLSVSCDFILIFGLAFVFLIIQIFLYRFISKSHL